MKCRLDDIMEIKGITGRELAERTGLKESYISGVKNNKRKNITLEIAFNIANSLNMSINDIWYSDKEASGYDEVIRLAIEKNISVEKMKKIIEILE